MKKITMDHLQKILIKLDKEHGVTVGYLKDGLSYSYNHLSAFGYTQLLLKEFNLLLDQTNDGPYKKEIELLLKFYPTTKGKTIGLKRLTKQIKTDKDLKDIEESIKHYANTEEVQRGFIKHISTFANCWRDYIPIDAPVKRNIRV